MKMYDEMIKNINENPGKKYFVLNGKDGYSLTDNQDDLKGKDMLVGVIPSIDDIKLGSKTFCDDYNVKFPYMAGAMANGIASEKLVIALGKSGYMGSFGSGGLSLKRIGEAIDKIQSELKDGAYCFNLLYNLRDQKAEMETVEMYLKKNVRVIEAAAFNVNLSLPLVYYRVKGLTKDESGNVKPYNRVIAKISRHEIAEKFISPPPAKYVDELLKLNLITKKEADLSQFVSMADDITVEADSAGHTDNRPLISLLPAMITLNERLCKQYKYSKTLRIGAAGGISTPQSILGAFAMGADYVVTGSINQAAVESGTSSLVRDILKNAQMPDVMMAPAADMFELGAKVQVLKKGTMFPLNAQKLYEIYKLYPSVDAIPEKERLGLESRIFKKTLSDVWNETVTFFNATQPDVITSAVKDGRKKMALIFRWYLGKSSRWALEENPERILDSQIWCGQAMGAFNEWAKGTKFEKVPNRKAGEIANELILEAKLLKRIDIFKSVVE